jgi:hypothetical protein
MDKIRHRIYAGDESGDIGDQMAKAVQRLVVLERQATADAILGRNYPLCGRRRRRNLTKLSLEAASPGGFSIRRRRSGTLAPISEGGHFADSRG